ncbi:stage VI sporulation protein D [Neobacillus terrae]|uniref:stage VI sporulation protein D n=1 Tax=Neobacillus terrae TaxID=3034837 RepID=UPI00140B0B18|nr:stage VI sporulation protein D [Neobacillus terrae]NHM30494.1 stage VI sporulation protein D [Neobacillus terrae]
MSQENQSCLRFSLEESLWFRKGQEVTELVSISLDPDITIQENDQYVTIRGSLELTGEYVCNNENSEGEEESNPGHKYVQIVQDRESGTCQFSHRFPVDITIPNNRIKSIYDIDVVVESFDYSFPERSCMKLTSDLTISGLYGEQQHEREEEKVEARSQKELAAEEQEAFEEETASVQEDEAYPVLEEEDTFHAEARKQVTEEAPVEVLEIPSFAYQALKENYHQDFLAEFARSEEKQKQEVARSEEKQESKVARSEEKQEPEVARSEEKQEVVVQEQAQPEMVTVIEEETAVAELEPESSSSPEKIQEAKPKKKKQGNKKSMSLTEFFARREETNESAKLKVCIVQKGDTLNLLSERYDIPVQNLARVNQMELNQDVYEGQVLYIPVAVGKK